MTDIVVEYKAKQDRYEAKVLLDPQKHLYMVVGLYETKAEAYYASKEYMETLNDVKNDITVSAA